MKYDEYKSVWMTIEHALLRQAARRAHFSYPEWVDLERAVVASTANRMAERYGLVNRVTVEWIEENEGPALGHYDYAHRLALIVADFIWGTD